MNVAVNGSDHFGVLSKELEQEQLIPMSNSTHPMADESLTWTLSDTSTVLFHNIKTGVQIKICTLQTYTEKGVLCVALTKNPEMPQ